MKQLGIAFTLKYDSTRTGIILPFLLGIVADNGSLRLSNINSPVNAFGLRKKWISGSIVWFGYFGVINLPCWL